MSSEPNRRSLRRIFLLPEDADDAKIAAAIRRYARGFRKMGRPFVLAPGLDLMECLAALDRQRKGEEELAFQLLDQIDHVKQKIRSLDLRCLALDLVREARDHPPDYDPLSHRRNQPVVEPRKRRKPKLDQRCDHEVDDAARAGGGKPVQSALDAETDL